MKKLTITALVTALSLGLSTPVIAQAKQEMTVTGTAPKFDQWVVTTSRALDKQLARADISDVNSGITYVRFNCNEHGKPQNLATVSTRKYKSKLDRLGHRVVQNLDLHPMFDGSNPNQIVEAAIIVANSERDRDRMLKQVNERAKKQNAKWAALNLPNPVISLALANYR